MSPAEREARQKLGEFAVNKAKDVLVYGDRVGVTGCPGTKRTIQFCCWFGQWMVSKTGREYHPISVYAVNGVETDFKEGAPK